MSSKSDPRQKMNNSLTLPCWLFVILNFCVIDPLPFAGRELPLAGSNCS